MVQGKDSAAEGLEGFIVGFQAGLGSDRVYLLGRFRDGPSFAIADSRWRQGLCVPASLLPAAEASLSGPRPLPYSVDPAGVESFDGRPCVRLKLPPASFRAGAERLGRAGIECLEADLKPRDAYLLDALSRGGLRVWGSARPGKRVDLVFSDPRIEAADYLPALRWAAFDLETSPEGRLRAASIALSAKESEAEAFLLHPGPLAGSSRGRTRLFGDEASLLSAFSARVVELDPDVLTGWNVIEFDFRVLSERSAALGLPFDLGRSEEPSRYLPGTGGSSSAVIVPGRQCLDAMRIARSGPERFEDLKLETVARAVLGRGKSLASAGKRKIEELEGLYRERPLEYARYCALDSALVLGILEKTGLKELTQARAALTGVSLDRAWTSIPAFERLYSGGLRARGIAIPPVPAETDSGSPGGLILEPVPGLFRDVLVLDFKSLYPTVIRTFNIDPLARRRSGGEDDIVAPNGARFSRAKGILPEAIAEYFSLREMARARGDAVGVYVYKILMNSFYGVLGAQGCRYAGRDLAGAVTGFGQKYLQWTGDWARASGYRVLYGDTDSAFLQAPPGKEGGLEENGNAIVASLNAALAQAVREEYGLMSYLEIKLEKVYDRFYLPRVRVSRDSGEARGRAKGYAGRMARSGEIEVKGMEAARSDWTPLAREFQIELLKRVFAGEDEASIRDFVDRRAREVLEGKHDGKLVFKRVLRRPPEDYVKNEPPIVKAARMLGWTKGRGTVEYLVTQNGPEPLSMRSSPIDYAYYVHKQLLPMVRSIRETTGLDILPRDAGSGQMELEF